MKCRIIGVSPLLQNNGQMADQLNPIVKEMKKITSKRMKTDADIEQMAKLEFLGGLYVQDGKIVIPGEVIEGALVNTAKQFKKGKTMLSAAFCETSFPLEYAGEQDYKKRVDIPECRKTMGVVIKRNRIMRTRPIFHNWAANIELMYDPEQINLSEIKDILQRAGEKGIGDYRPKFGRFRVEFD